MDPVISPFLVYLIGIIGAIEGLLFFISVLAGACIILYHVIKLIICMQDSKYSVEKGLDDWKNRWSVPILFKIPKIKFLYFLCLIMTMLCIAIPNKKVFVGMIVANEITHDRVEMVGGEIGKLKDQVFNSINNTIDGEIVTDLPELSDKEIDKVVNALPDDSNDEIIKFFKKYKEQK